MIYTGQINFKTMPKHLKAAANSYYAQMHRCNNPKCATYEKYGGKGICVNYSVREFIAWWNIEYNKRKEWKCATVSRIDHDQDYDFSNIKLEEKSENTTERNKRVRNSCLKRKILAQHNTGSHQMFGSVAECSNHFSIPRRSLIDLLVMRYGKNTRNGIEFKYYQGDH